MLELEEHLTKKHAAQMQKLVPPSGTVPSQAHNLRSWF
jgi:hypothetical protein